MNAFEYNDGTIDRSAAFEALASVFGDLAAIADGGVPAFEWPDHEQRIADVSTTDTAFARTWADVTARVGAHLDVAARDDTLERRAFSGVSISAHPATNHALTLTVRYEARGCVTVDVENP